MSPKIRINPDFDDKDLELLGYEEIDDGDEIKWRPKPKDEAVSENPAEVADEEEE